MRRCSCQQSRQHQLCPHSIQIVQVGARKGKKKMPLRWRQKLPKLLNHHCQQMGDKRIQTATHATMGQVTAEIPGNQELFLGPGGIFLLSPSTAAHCPTSKAERVHSSTNTKAAATTAPEQGFFTGIKCKMLCRTKQAPCIHSTSMHL